MILHSDSGYCMPFEEPRGKDVELSLGYGEQVHPTTGEKFFHHGIDFKARCYMLSAVASGIVSGEMCIRDSLQGVDCFSGLFFQREMAGVSCLPRSYRR